MPIYSVKCNYEVEIEADNDMEAIDKFVQAMPDNIECELSDCQYSDQQELEDRERDFEEEEKLTGERENEAKNNQT